MSAAPLLGIYHPDFKDAVDGAMANALGRALHGEDRKRVDFRYDIFSLRNVGDCYQAHLSLKFEYKKALIQDTFMKDEGLLFPSERQSEKFSIIPYMILNMMEETQVSWYGKEFQKTSGEGSQRREETWVQERIETIVTLTSCQYSKFFPWELNIFFMRIQMNGTAASSKVNLVPMNPPGRHGLFRKKTSKYKLEKEDDAICQMYVRDARPSTEIEEHNKFEFQLETSVTMTFIFEGDTVENFLKYLGVATYMLFLLPLIPAMELGDLAGTGLAMILALVGLLYVLPANDEFTTTEKVITIHILMILILTGILGWLKTKTDLLDDEHDGVYTVFAIIFLYVLLTIGFIVWEANQFLSLKNDIKEVLTYDINPLIGPGPKYPDSESPRRVGMFQHIADMF